MVVTFGKKKNLYIISNFQGIFVLIGKYEYLVAFVNNLFFKRKKKGKENCYFMYLLYLKCETFSLVKKKRFLC